MNSDAASFSAAAPVMFVATFAVVAPPRAAASCVSPATPFVQHAEVSALSLRAPSLEELRTPCDADPFLAAALSLALPVLLLPANYAFLHAAAAAQCLNRFPLVFAVLLLCCYRPGYVAEV